MILRLDNTVRDPAQREQLLREALPLVREGGVTVVMESVDAPAVRVAVFDLDATLIPCEFVDLLAARRGVEHLTRDMTALAMSGEMDFRTSYLRRMEILGGTPVALVEELIETLTSAPGAAEAIAMLRAAGIRTAIITGGYARLARAMRERLCMDAVWATELEERDGVLTGRMAGPLLDEEGKVEALKSFCAASGLTPLSALAVGDGANDLKMLSHAGCAILYTSVSYNSQGVMPLDRILGFGSLPGLPSI
jgi:phosphoserine phosphatase